MAIEDKKKSHLFFQVIKETEDKFKKLCKYSKTYSTVYYT